jgi:hypothetical protein
MKSLLNILGMTVTVVTKVDMVVGVATRPRPGWAGYLLPTMANDLSAHTNVQAVPRAHSASYSVNTGVCFLGNKAARP